MRNLSPDALTKLAENYGTEPINIVEIEWTVGTSSWYADRQINDVPARILDMGTLDSVVSLSLNATSSEVTVKLDDTIGDLKVIFNTIDIQSKVVRIWQWFEGLNWSDKFLIFAGVVNSPISWSERDRSLEFNVVSKLEDKEIGFSAEEGQFPWCPADLVGKPWPMAFGTPLDYPALQINQAVKGILATGVGIVSGQEYRDLWAADNLSTTSLTPSGPSSPDIGQAQAQFTFVSSCAADFRQGAAMVGGQLHATYTQRAVELEKQQWEIYTSINKTVVDFIRQKAQQACQTKVSQLKQECEAANKLGQNATEIAIGESTEWIRIINGEDFPQGVQIILEIGGGEFTGYFNGTTANPSEMFHIDSRFHPDNQKQVDASAAELLSPSCPDDTTTCQYPEQSTLTVLTMDTPAWEVGRPWQLAEKKTWVIHQPNTQSSTHSKTGGDGRTFNMIHFWADAGSSVSLKSAEPMYNIASIVPCEILTVKAFQQAKGDARRLVNLPSNRFTLERINFGAVTADCVKVVKPLSTYADENWEDAVYVTVRSTVGPNIANILVYLISTYTKLAYNWSDFNTVATDLAPFPANFPLLDRKNILQVLEEIAFQARCALWLDDGVFRIRYLAKEDTSVSTITLKDVDFEKGVSVDIDNTENLVTKYKATWHLTWADRDEFTKTTPNGSYVIVLRNNVEKYGLLEEDYDFYIYNQPDIVYKVATFWLIRKSNTWKRVKFNTFLQKLNLETFDTVTLDFGTNNYVSTGPIKVSVEKAAYDSANNTIEFECLTPIRCGEMVQYPFFWTATLPAETTFPTPHEIEEGWCGGNGIGTGASGTLPIGMVPTGSDTIFIGGMNVIFGPHSDWGDAHVSDVGFKARPISVQPIQPYQVTPKPLVPLSLVGIPGRTIMTDSINAKTGFLQMNGGVHLGIGLDDMCFYDPDNPQKAASLRSIVKMIDDKKNLLLNTKALYEHNTEGKTFDFKFDTDGDQYGAGTAFLQSE